MFLQTGLYDLCKENLTYVKFSCCRKGSTKRPKSGRKSKVGSRSRSRSGDRDSKEEEPEPSPRPVMSFSGWVQIITAAL